MIKKINYFIMSLLYPIPKKIEKVNKKEQISFTIDKRLYKIYNVFSARLYTDTIHNFGLIKKQTLLEGPSFQIINDNFSNIKNNIIREIGTPRLKKKLKGPIFALLTGGAGNHNYYHWLFDVLPRLKLLEMKIDIKKIKYFLFPSLDYEFQLETIKFLKIPLSKCISSLKYRHIYSDKIIVTSHPRIHTKNSTKDNENTPNWISNWLKEKFIPLKSKKYSFNKIYIDRRTNKINDNIGRSIINNDDVKSFLKKEGFESIFLEDYSFKDQVCIFNKANFIVGLHGAGFANLVFCKKGTKVIEILNRSTSKEIKNLAISNKLIYLPMYGIPRSKIFNQQGHLEVPLNLLKKKVSILGKWRGSSVG